MNRPPISVCTLILVFSVLASGCLTSAHKELRVSLNPDAKSGSATVLFTDIHSESSNDTSDLTLPDFNSLITEYYQGTKLSTMYPHMSNIKKRIYLDGKIMMGEVTFNFANIADLGFYRYNGAGPFMFYTFADGYFSSGTFEASNGSFGGEKMPFIFWDSTTRDFFVNVALAQPEAPQHSLIDRWKVWAKK